MISFRESRSTLPIHFVTLPVKCRLNIMSVSFLNHSVVVFGYISGRSFFIALFSSIELLDCCLRHDVIPSQPSVEFILLYQAYFCAYKFISLSSVSEYLVFVQISVNCIIIFIAHLFLRIITRSDSPRFQSEAGNPTLETRFESILFTILDPPVLSQFNVRCSCLFNSLLTVPSFL